MKDFILRTLAEMKNGYSLCGVIDRKGRIYPLGSDTKVISSLFEIVTRQAVIKYADSLGLQLKERTYAYSNVVRFRSTPEK